ncbi:MAG: erythromycin esterase family protein [Bacteroidota bacterium]
MGFEVILFESGIGELILADLHQDKLSSTQMTYGFFSGWRTKEFGELMEYIKAENLSLAGFDVQRTGGSFKHVLRDIGTAAKLDTTLFVDLESRFGALKPLLTNRRIEYNDSIALLTNNLIHDYEQVYDHLLETDQPLPIKKSLLTLRALQNRKDYLRYMLDFKKDMDWNKRWAARDSLMANNLVWLSENIYQNRKIIVIGHNYHISQFSENEEAMGEFLLRKYPDDMYSIGVYTKTGTYLGNYGNEKEMSGPDENQLDIKHCIAAIGHELSFLPIPEKRTKGEEWLYEEIITSDTFVDLSNSNSIILSKHFDALLLLQNSSPPEK